MTTTYASYDPAVIAFVASQNAGPDNRGSTAPFAPAILVNGIAGTTANNVIGFNSLTSSGTSPIAMGTGFNSVIIDGANSMSAAGNGAYDNYSFTVDSTGLVTLTDTVTSKTQQISGVSFLVFDGAALGGDVNGNTVYQQIYYIGNANQTEATELYNAAFGRQPDLGGVEYYMHQLNSGFTFQQIANEFMASPEFQTRYGANVSDTQFVTNLYTNVLHRSASAAETAYYTAALANAAAGSIVNTTNPVLWSRGQELLNFTNSPENQIDTAGFVINTAATPANGLVYSTPPAASETPATVLNQALSTGNVDTTLIDPTTITAATTNGHEAIGTPNYLFPKNGVSTGTSTGTYTLSPGIPDFFGEVVNATYAVNGSATGGSNIVISGGTVNLHGTGNNINQGVAGTQPFTNTTITLINGFVQGDTLQTETTTGGLGIYAYASPTSSTPLLGSSLTGFALGTSASSHEYIVNVGDVGGGSAQEVASAANKVYVVSDGFFEQIIFVGQVSSGVNRGSTAVFDWVNYSGAPGTADSNGNHLVSRRSDYDRLVHAENGELLGRDEQLNASGDAWLLVDQSELVEGLEHLVN